MKCLIILLLSCTATYGQFGSFGNIAGSFQQNVNNVGAQLPKAPFVDNIHDFSGFVQQTGKTYSNAADRAIHEAIFQSHKALVEAQNKLNKGYELALNAFADYTPEEFLSRLTGRKKSSHGDAAAKADAVDSNITSEIQLPDTFDWREKGGVTAVKFQGDCGSCWAFASTGAIEGHLFRKSGKLIDLSEQNMVDCGETAYGLAGCDGGFQEYAFEFVIRQKGLADAVKYPYVDRKDTCSYKNALKATEIQKFGVIAAKDEEQLKRVVATLGPVACSVNGLETLMLYHKGIYADEECNKGEPNHSVLVVGYGQENGTDYWIIKNSWNETWGEQGYFRLPRGKNFCHIATECSYPIL